MLTDTFTGIRPADVIGFILAQALGALLAWSGALLGRPSPGSPRGRS
jgi:hypothetical protein